MVLPTTTTTLTLALALVVILAVSVDAACNINNTGSIFVRGNSPYGSGASFILGTAASYAVLAGSKLTSTGATVLTGDLGVSPGSAITGFGPGTFTGTEHAADSYSLLAQSDAEAAYNRLVGLACNGALTGTNLGGLTLPPGVYFFAGSATLSNVTLTLQGTNSLDDAWVFQIASTLTTETTASVILTRGARSSNVFWQVGSSATLNGPASFVGTILAYTAVSLTSKVDMDGRALALNAAVTLIDNAITVPSGSSSNCTPIGTLSFLSFVHIRACVLWFVHPSHRHHCFLPRSFSPVPILLNSTQSVEINTTSLAVSCASSSCPVNATGFAGLPFSFAGAGAGNMTCASVTSVSANGFTCQLSGSFSSTGGDVYLLINTVVNGSCFGESGLTLVATVASGGGVSSTAMLSSRMWIALAALALMLLRLL